ncbi:hypothetical protein BJY52DRAFT_1227851 [Lactarius psammicola]|nr:hypothetical protein BJY52DRAFT_1227851 [Lactarius psammicola]
MARTKQPARQPRPPLSPQRLAEIRSRMSYMSTAKPKKKSAARRNRRKIRDIDLTKEIRDLQREIALHSTSETPPCTKDGQTLARDEQPSTQERNEPERGNPTTSAGSWESENNASAPYFIGPNLTGVITGYLCATWSVKQQQRNRTGARSSSENGRPRFRTARNFARVAASVGNASCLSFYWAMRDLFKAQGENKRINAKDMSSTRPCVVILIVNVSEEVSTESTKPVTINIAMRGSGFKGVDAGRVRRRDVRSTFAKENVLEAVIPRAFIAWVNNAGKGMDRRT